MSADSPAPPPPGVVVIGGGPAGSTAATLIARRGHRVTLYERQRFPRSHVGESLLPASLPILEELGALRAVQRHGFVRKLGATMIWGSDPEPWTWYFRESNGPFEHSYQVLRSEFDHLLLDNASRHGVDVRTEHRVVDVLFDGERASGVVVEGPGGEQWEEAAAQIVDASGQHALIASRRGQRQWDDFFRNLAIYSYFTGGDHLAPPDDGNIFIESFDHGWLWKIPLHTGVSSVGAVVDSEWGQQQLREHSPEVLLDRLISGAPRTARLLQDGYRTEPPVVLKDWSYMSDQLVGDGYILVGDAACFVDPLFSSGVHLALMSGLLASAYVCTVLRDPSMRRPAAAAYEAQYRRKYGYFHEIAKMFYSSNRTVESYFWDARRLAGDEWTGTPREAFLNIVAGNAPEGYERAVIERGDVPEALSARARALDDRKRARLETLRDLAEADGELFATVPRLANGASLARELTVRDGEFRWTDLLVTPRNPHGEYVIPPVAQLVSLVDGKRSVSEIVRVMRASVPRQHHEELRRSVVTKVGQLFADGTIDIGAPGTERTTSH